jgi:hypothetical protein
MSLATFVKVTVAAGNDAGSRAAFALAGRRNSRSGKARTSAAAKPEDGVIDWAKSAIADPQSGARRRAAFTRVRAR